MSKQAPALLATLALCALLILSALGCAPGRQSSSSSGGGAKGQTTAATTAERTDITESSFGLEAEPERTEQDQSGATSPSKGHAQSSPGPLPNATLHPGATNPDVTQDNIKSTICVPGFTKKIRPDKSYTDNLKKQQLASEGLPGTPSDYEEDHLISLELGGNPTDPKNLWPEPWEKKGSRLASSGTGAETKDRTEDYTHKQVCEGKMSLADAQSRISSDWHSLWEDEGRP